jgi:dTDP-4-dehydrorhamnose reductase
MGIIYNHFQIVDSGILVPVTRVALFGSSGMLGSAMAKFFEIQGFEVIEFNRSGKSVIGKNKVVKFDVCTTSDLQMKVLSLNVDVIVNAVGMIRQIIDESSTASVKRAFQINSDFPRMLNELSIKSSIPVIQIGTDCVFSGSHGNYVESSKFDPKDVYGKSKFEGESLSTSTIIIRTSVIGKELNSSNSLLDWVLNQEKNAIVKGYANHYWNGVTTLHFAKVVAGIILNDAYNLNVHHLVPSNIVSKFDLIKIIAETFGREDLEIIEHRTDISVNRTLSTNDFSQNSIFWRWAGYNQAPSIQAMVDEFANSSNFV